MALFFYTNSSQGNFLCCPKLFVITKNFNTARSRTVTLNFYNDCYKNCYIEFFFVEIFVSFVKLLNINLKELSLFLSHLKSVFKIVIGSE